MNALTIKTKPLLLLTAVAMLFIVGCKCSIEQPQATFVAPLKGKHHRIAAADFGTAIVHPGDTLTLDFPCAPELPALPEGVEGLVNGNSATIWTSAPRFENAAAKSLNFGPAANSFKHVIQFTTPQYAVTMQSGENFLPGDANADGKRDMLDVYPIARAIWELGGGIDWDIPNFDPLTAPNPLDTNQTYLRPATNSTWQWTANGSVVDYVHADCNFDGTVDMDDLELLKKVLEPSQLPNFLNGAYSGITINATHYGDVEVFQPSTQSYPEVRAWYDISINSTNGIDSILGVVFTRAVDEVPPNPPAGAVYKVKAIQADVTGSALFATETDRIFYQRYWDNIKIDLPDSCELAPGVVSRPLDVGIFNRTGPQAISSGDRLINCCVTIDDILRQVQNGTTPIYQHLINVVVFSVDAAGNITATTTNCEFDAVKLNPENIKIYKKIPSNWWSNQ